MTLVLKGSCYQITTISLGMQAVQILLLALVQALALMMSHCKRMTGSEFYLKSEQEMQSDLLVVSRSYR